MPELRRELEQRGHRFRTRTDTETVLEAFLEWDTDCFSRLRGMFAIALWTESRQRLVLARDRMGIKPLYIARHGEDLYFGSELKTIFVHPEIERRLSLDGLDCYLSLNYVPAPWTLVEGIEKLRPGHWLEWQAGAVRDGGLLAPAARDGTRLATGRGAAELDRLLRHSVSEHLLSDVPLGVWLSGGIDSSTVLHYAATASRQRLKTFSISFRGRSFDETALHPRGGQAVRHRSPGVRREPGSRAGGRHRRIRVLLRRAQRGRRRAAGLVSVQDDPAEVTVALSGEGADELFGGYLTYRADRYARRMRRLPASVLGLALARRAALAGVRREDRLRIHAEAVSGRLPDGRRRGRMFIGTARSPTRKNARCLRARLPAALAACWANWRGGRRPSRLSVVRPEILSCRTIF